MRVQFHASSVSNLRQPPPLAPSPHRSPMSLLQRFNRSMAGGSRGLIFGGAALFAVGCFVYDMNELKKKRVAEAASLTEFQRAEQDAWNAKVLQDEKLKKQAELQQAALNKQ